MKYTNIYVDGKSIGVHRHKMQLFLGRKLSRHEVVHHIDEDKSNNSILNLKLMSYSEHNRLHHNSLLIKDSTREKCRLNAIKNSPKSKLNSKLVLEIRNLISNGQSIKEISEKKNLSFDIIRNVKIGKYYSWVK